VSDRRQALSGGAKIVPHYSLAGLFESGLFGLAEESAIEELAAVRNGVRQMVVPSAGWLSPRYTDSNDRAVPRALGQTAQWNRYKAFWRLNSGQALAPTPNDPWGLTWAAVVMILLTEPVTFTEMAHRLEMPAIDLVEKFCQMIYAYSKGDKGNIPTFTSGFRPNPKKRAQKRKIITENT